MRLVSLLTSHPEENYGPRLENSDTLDAVRVMATRNVKGFTSSWLLCWAEPSRLLVPLAVSHCLQGVFPNEAS